MLSEEDDRQQSEDIDHLINTTAKVILEIVIRDTLLIEAALKTGHPEVALVLVEGFLKGSQAMLDKFKC